MYLLTCILVFLFIADLLKIRIPATVFVGAAIALIATQRTPKTHYDIIILFIHIQFIFAFLYTASYLSNSNSFTGVYSTEQARKRRAESGFENLSLVFDMIYFSMTVFATVGFGDIAPSSIMTRTIAITEMCVAYTMTASILMRLFA